MRGMAALMADEKDSQSTLGFQDDEEMKDDIKKSPVAPSEEEK